MIEAEEMRVIGSMMDDIRALKKRVEEMEAQLQALVDMHCDSELEVRDDYVERLDELEKKGEFEEFSDIEELKRRFEDKGS